MEGNRGKTINSEMDDSMRGVTMNSNEDGNKVSDVRGIRAACKVMKTRYAKPFESVQVKIPYETGMDPYSGLIDMLEEQGYLKKDGNRLAYTSPVTGEVFKEFRKNWTNEQLNQIMEEVMTKYAQLVRETPAEDTEEGE